MRIGLVLAAGGSVGVAYHGAVMAALEQATGWDPRQAEVVVGTSAGSLTAAMLRAGVPAGDLARISEGAPLSEEGARLATRGRPRRPRPGLLDVLAFRPVSDLAVVLQALRRPWTVPPRALALAAMPAGGIPTTAISDGIDALYEGAWPEKALWLCSYDLRAGRRVVFGQAGSPPALVGGAVAASCAVPGYFRPVSIDGRRYVDGGVHSMVNLDLVAGLGLDLVIAVSPLSQAAAWGVPSPALVMRRPLRARLGAEVAALERAGVAVVAIQPGRRVTSAMGFNPMDAARRGAVSRATRAGVRRWLAEGVQGRQLTRLLKAEAARSPRAERPAPARRGTA
ncbi:MAG: patatin-like phospholipase family protein [Actinomycetota bacterium]|nr:patatin-like phospholipase family protein [Actinomycetota bacterium]